MKVEKQKERNVGVCALFDFVSCLTQLLFSSMRWNKEVIWLETSPHAIWGDKAKAF